jgi:hypothetical protein
MLVQIRTFLTLSVLPFLFKRTFRSLDSVLRLKSILSRVQSIEVVHIFETSFKKKRTMVGVQKPVIVLTCHRHEIMFYFFELNSTSSFTAGGKCWVEENSALIEPSRFKYRRFTPFEFADLFDPALDTWLTLLHFAVHQHHCFVFRKVPASNLGP